MAASASRLIACGALGVAISLAGCKTAGAPAAAGLPEAAPPRAGEVGMEIVPPPPGAPRMQLPQSQRFIFPNLEEPAPLPIYPPQLLAARLAPVVVCVELDIGADGSVGAARPRLDPACVDKPVRQEFLDAAIAAVSQWGYAPALLCKAPDATLEDACLHPQVVETPTPVRLSYAFSFSQRDGRPTVERVGAD